MIKAFLIDFDGTLVETESLKAQAFAQACISLGGEANPSLYMSVVGTSMQIAFDLFTHHAKISPTYETFAEEYIHAYQNLLNGEFLLTPGATDLIHYAIKFGIKLAIVSSESQATIQAVLSKFELVDSFNLLISNELVTHHKPNPEPYLLALSQLNLSPREVVAFEDSTSGLLAATNAGCRCVAVSHRYNEVQDLSLAEMVVTSFSDFLTTLQKPTLQY